MLTTRLTYFYVDSKRIVTISLINSYYLTTLKFIRLRGFGPSKHHS
jgi:hypothetical protein